jgi:hypothetical protein
MGAAFSFFVCSISISIISSRVIHAIKNGRFLLKEGSFPRYPVSLLELKKLDGLAKPVPCDRLGNWGSRSVWSKTQDLKMREMKMPKEAQALLPEEGAPM